jgi:pimeloyl-ACP methyl ester carboxylesterase
VAGFDWGGVASCVAAALRPDKIGGLVSYAGYDIVDIKRQQNGFPLSLEKSIWDQHLFQTERGRVALTESHKELAGMLYCEWSPNWKFDEATLSMTAASFDNPDFVDVVLHCYRFHFGLADGDPKLQPLEAILARRPIIRVPSVTLDGTDDPLKPGGTAHHAKMFVDRHEHRVITAGHNIPKENPSAFADAIFTVRHRLDEGKAARPMTPLINHHKAVQKKQAAMRSIQLLRTNFSLIHSRLVDEYLFDSLSAFAREICADASIAVESFRASQNLTTQQQGR